jgi:hypothetical protein
MRLQTRLPLRKRHLGTCNNEKEIIGGQKRNQAKKDGKFLLFIFSGEKADRFK